MRFTHRCVHVLVQRRTIHTLSSLPWCVWFTPTFEDVDDGDDSVDETETTMTIYLFILCIASHCCITWSYEPFPTSSSSVFSLSLYVCLHYILCGNKWKPLREMREINNKHLIIFFFLSSSSSSMCAIALRAYSTHNIVFCRPKLVSVVSGSESECDTVKQKQFSGLQNRCSCHSFLFSICRIFIAKGCVKVLWSSFWYEVLNVTTNWYT